MEESKYDGKKLEIWELISSEFRPREKKSS
jgi:hypothetical protein